MGAEIFGLNCPGCGAPQQVTATTCEFCGRPVIITTFTSVESMPLPMLNKYVGSYNTALGQNPSSAPVNKSAAFCYMKLKNYDKAVEKFEKAMEDDFDDSENYFYAAVCLLKGGKPFVCDRPVIDKIEQYLDAAISVSPRGIYYYFRAYVRNDYFERNYLMVRPTYREFLDMAISANVTEGDKAQFWRMLGVDKPAAL